MFYLLILAASRYAKRGRIGHRQQEKMCLGRLIAGIYIYHKSLTISLHFPYLFLKKQYRYDHDEEVKLRQNTYRLLLHSVLSLSGTFSHLKNVL